MVSSNRSVLGLLMRNIFITGATGTIGPTIIAALHASGYHIHTLSRHVPPPGLFPDDVEIHTGDITDSSAVRSAIKSCDTVVHMAALLHIVNPSPELRSRYEHINVGGTANVVKAAMEHGVRKLIFFSTIAVYGDTGGQIVTEETPPRPNSLYAQTKLDAEKIVLQARNPYGQPIGVILRLGAVYGPRVKGNYRRLVQALARGRFIPIGSGRNRRTLVYDKDVAQAVLLALESPLAAGRIYNVTDGKYHTMSEIIASICGALGRPLPRLKIPVTPARIAARVLDTVGSRVFRHPLHLRAAIDKYTEDIAVDGHRIQEELGFVPHYDLATGWNETIQEMRLAGDL